MIHSVSGWTLTATVKCLRLFSWVSHNPNPVPENRITSKSNNYLCMHLRADNAMYCYCIQIAVQTYGGTSLNASLLLSRKLRLFETWVSVILTSFRLFLWSHFFLVFLKNAPQSHFSNMTVAAWSVLCRHLGDQSGLASDGLGNNEEEGSCDAPRSLTRALLNPPSEMTWALFLHFYLSSPPGDMLAGLNLGVQTDKSHTDNINKKNRTECWWAHQTGGIVGMQKLMPSGYKSYLLAPGSNGHIVLCFVVFFFISFFYRRSEEHTSELQSR